MSDCILVSVLGSGQMCKHNNIKERRNPPRFEPTFIYHERHQHIGDEDMNQTMIRKMSDRKRPVIAIREDEEPIESLAQVCQACRAVGWSQSEINDVMNLLVYDGLDAFIDSINVCME